MVNAWHHVTLHVTQVKWTSDATQDAESHGINSREFHEVLWLLWISITFFTSLYVFYGFSWFYYFCELLWVVYMVNVGEFWRCLLFIWCITTWNGMGGARTYLSPEIIWNSNWLKKLFETIYPHGTAFEIKSYSTYKSMGFSIQLISDSVLRANQPSTDICIPPRISPFPPPFSSFAPLLYLGIPPWPPPMIHEYNTCLYKTIENQPPLNFGWFITRFKVTNLLAEHTSFISCHVY